VSLSVHNGAVVLEDDALRALLVLHPGAGPAGNYVACPRWTVADWRDRLERSVSALRRAGAWPSLLLADRLDRPVGLETVLSGDGWSSVLRETVMWVGRAATVPHLDALARIEAVRPTSVEEHERLERQVFGLADVAAADRCRALAEALETGRLRAFLVRVGDEPVAVARLSLQEGIAGIYALGVAAPWRRRGYATLLTTVATRAGLALGHRLVWLSVQDGNDAARRVYERLGFTPAFSWSRWMKLAG
jgi:ribosomal protein S18 acetylase RimI-like enzyme